MKRFLKKALRGTAILLATLAVLLLVFYAEEDWRGARDWAACQRDLAAKGETLDLHELIPPGNPADDLSQVPIFAPLFQKDVDPHAPISQVSHNLKTTGSEPDLSQYRKNTRLDLVAWQKFYRALPQSGLPPQARTPAQDILQVLSRFNSRMDEIDTALDRPNAYFPVDLEKPSAKYPATQSLIAISALLQLRAIAHLENKESDLAKRDYLSSLKLMSPFNHGGSFVIYVLLSAVRSFGDAILWEGIHRHAWSDPQLREMESALAKTDWLVMGRKSLWMSMAFALRQIGTPEKERAMLHNLLFSDDNSEAVIDCFWLRPNGWNLQDKTACVSQVQALIDAIDPEKGTIRREAFDLPSTSSLAHRIRFDYVPLAVDMQSIDPLEGSMIAKAETNCRLARLACRLEEYRIAHAAYPDKLSDLPDLPAHLNQEVLSEQPLQYHRQGDGYQLYSIGWNQKDDGGAYNVDSKQGDWSWPNPELPQK